MPQSILDRFLSTDAQKRIVAAIRDAEAQTLGEIRIHIESRCPKSAADVEARAKALFTELGMAKTRERNGVLLYVAVDDRRFAIVGDEGIHRVAGHHLWQTAVQLLGESFRRGDHGDGLVAAISAVGRELQAQFPRRAEDSNELPDEISTGETLRKPE